MKSAFLLCVTVLHYSAAPLQCSEPKYQKSFAYVFEEPSNEVLEIAGRARRDPKVVRELQRFPLESTYEILMNLMQKGYEGKSEEVIMVATEVLSTHPQFEEFLTKHTAHMAKLLEPAEPPPPLDNEANRQRDVAFHKIAGLLSSARFLQGDGAFRVIGPRLFDRTWREFGDDYYSASSHSYAAAANLVWLMKERLPNEPVPKDLEECRTWWKVNAERFSEKANQPQPASSPPASLAVPKSPVAPAPFRVPAPKASQPSAEKDRSSVTRLFVLYGALLLLSVGGLALWVTRNRESSKTRPTN